MRKSDFNKPHLNEGLADLADAAERDHEVQMARAELYKIAKYAIKLHDMLKGVSEQEGLEAWVQSKITKAADYVGSVYHHLDYETNFDDQDAQVISMSTESSYKDSLKQRLEEKAVSKAQQSFMGMVYAAKKGGKPASKEVAKVAKGMSKGAAKDFAKTKHKGLPDKVNEGWFSDSPEELAQKSPQMAKLIKMRDEHKKCYDDYTQILKRIEILADRLNMDGGEVMGPGGQPKDVLSPDDFRKENPKFIKK